MLPHRPAVYMAPGKRPWGCQKVCTDPDGCLQWLSSSCRGRAGQCGSLDRSESSTTNGPPLAAASDAPLHLRVPRTKCDGTRHASTGPSAQGAALQHTRSTRNRSLPLSGSAEGHPLPLIGAEPHLPLFERQHVTMSNPLAMDLHGELNRKAVASSFHQKQSDFHEVILSWCSNRFLSSNSNPLSHGIKHRSQNELFTPDSRGDSTSTEGFFLAQPRTLSVFDAAQLLDAFGDLYGNARSSQHRREASHALDSVLRTWVTQWLPSDSPTGQSLSINADAADDLLQSARAKELYSACWWQTHQMLVKTRVSASFTRAVAVLMFNLTAAPDAVTSKLPPGDWPLDLRDRALLQMQTLVRMLHDFSNQFQSSSDYRHLLESAAGVVHWFAYVRETSTSMMFDRPAILHDIHVPESFLARIPWLNAEIETFSDPLHATKVIMASHSLATSTIMLWRRVSRLKAMLKPRQPGASSSTAALESCCHLIEHCHANEVRILETEVDEPIHLNSESIVAFAHVLLPWNFGLLTVIRCGRQMQRLELSCVDRDLVGTLNALEISMLQSMMLVAAKLSSTQAEFTDVTTTPIAVVAQNSNLPLVAQILTAFVDHAIDLPDSIHLDTPAPSVAAGGSANSTSRRGYISRLLACLSSLHRTLDGASVVQEPLRTLMMRHSDVLMDIWLSIQQSRAA